MELFMKLYLCVTARPMSLLTVCGELRCTVMLSGRGGREENLEEKKYFETYLGCKCADVTHPTVTPKHSCAVFS